MSERRILPFYMTYPLPMYYQEEDTLMRDLEYLQQMYPVEAKKYQKKVSDVLDRLDYDGSMIYDEYPDKWQMYRLTQNIVDMIKQEEMQNRDTENTVNVISDEKWEWLTDLIQILLFYEIFRRRHMRKRNIFRF